MFLVSFPTFHFFSLSLSILAVTQCFKSLPTQKTFNLALCFVFFFGGGGGWVGITLLETLLLWQALWLLRYISYRKVVRLNVSYFLLFFFFDL